MSQIQFKKLFKLLEEIIGETLDYIGRRHHKQKGKEKPGLLGHSPPNPQDNLL